MSSPVTTEPLSDETPPPRPSTWAALRPLLLRLHFYAGVLVAPFLLVAAVTGLLYAASFELEKIIHRHELSVPASDTTVPLSQQVAAAQATRPGEPVVLVRPAAEPGATTQVLFDTPDGDSSTRLAVFVNPHTAEVRGTLESYGSSGALPVRTWISVLHRHLHLGEVGRIYSELAASWLWVVAAGGVVLWLSRRRAKRKVRALLLPERGVAGRRRVLSWHGSVGVWAVLGLLFLSATGLTWSKYAGDHFDQVRQALGWTTPSLAVAGGHSDHGGGGGDHAAHGGPADVAVFDRVTETARSGGLSGPLEIGAPREHGSPYLVKEIDKVWPTRMDQMAVAENGTVAGTLRFDDFPLIAKLSTWGINTHMGVMFGLVNQILLGVLAIGLVVLIVLGYRMWWQRRPTRERGWSFGRPYPRGGWRAVPWPALGVLVVVTAGVGYALPLLGVSLVAFLALDVILGRVRRKDT
ncbi:PepSY-associated TM helix domain-containing protein [Sinosporangium siamense]|uniref:Peptidase n=1 Tax=Sinosporangium siamense TaxID=1367973 RepID=A0A919RLX3_9ACTN|nr:PepSY domain-containing protein [Sinosporangium siamense]GII94844.1 peptidase [Sinosporangium siamense]